MHARVSSSCRRQVPVVHILRSPPPWAVTPAQLNPLASKAFARKADNGGRLSVEHGRTGCVPKPAVKPPNRWKGCSAMSRS